MKQIIILSGKGGTGKTSVTAALAHLAIEGEIPVQAVLTDADVDAANLELLCAPHVEEQHEFWSGKVAKINPQECNNCGACEEVCRFDAIYEDGDGYRIDPIPCEGCASCMYACPCEAIEMIEQRAGMWFHSHSRYGHLFHAELHPGQENSGKLVTLVKQQARLYAMDNELDLVLVDGPPGIGCPVISAVSGADLVLIVAEPSVAGVHDMQRALQTTDHFGVPAAVCINKADLHEDGTNQIATYCKIQDLPLIGKIPYDTLVTEAMVQGMPVTVYRPESQVSIALESIWKRLLSMVKGEEGAP
jgi:MinD superfamily P-loop ATPase